MKKMAATEKPLSNFAKRAVYVPLSTYYKCTNLQVVKALVHSRERTR